MQKVFCNISDIDSSCTFAPGLNHSIIEAQPFSAGLKRAEHGLAGFFIWDIDGLKALKEKPGVN
jgi:hypothetical protein